MKTAAAGRFEILCYHRIGLKSHPNGLIISKELFTKQMRFIRRHCHPVALSDLVQALREGKKIPLRAVAVTFDDGYRDTFETGFPILRRFKIPATIFVTTGFVDKKLPMHQNGRPLTWKMILEMQRKGIEIGCHTLTHVKLTRCSLREIDRQITKSRRRLEQMLGQPVELFAYPYGGPYSFNKKIQSRVRKAGFLAAVTTLPGSNHRKISLYGLRRMPPIKNKMDATVEELICDMQNKNPRKKIKIPGVSSSMIRMWFALKSPVKKEIPGSPFYWRIGRPAGL